MGLLTVGKPLKFSEAEATNVIEYVRSHGIIQFLNTWNRVKDLQNDDLRWGDEVKYVSMFVSFQFSPLYFT